MQLNLLRSTSFFSSVEDFNLIQYCKNRQFSREPPQILKRKIICIQEAKVVHFTIPLSKFELRKSEDIFPQVLFLLFFSSNYQSKIFGLRTQMIQECQCLQYCHLLQLTASLQNRGSHTVECLFVTVLDNGNGNYPGQHNMNAELEFSTENIQECQ